MAFIYQIFLNNYRSDDYSKMFLFYLRYNEVYNGMSCHFGVLLE